MARQGAAKHAKPSRVRETSRDGLSRVPPGFEALYRTAWGYAVVADSLALMREMRDDSVDLVMTSPPFALKRKKEYGNKDAREYADWFMPFAYEVHRILKQTGSFVIDIGGTWNAGTPTRALYQYELLIRLAERFHLAQEFFWHNPAKLPSPAEWVTVRRVRVTDAVNTVWWMSKSPWPKADNRRVLRPYSDSMKSLLQNGYKPKLRPSGHDISRNFRRDLYARSAASSRTRPGFPRLSLISSLSSSRSPEILYWIRSLEAMSQDVRPTIVSGTGSRWS